MKTQWMVARGTINTSLTFEGPFGLREDAESWAKFLRDSGQVDDHFGSKQQCEIISIYVPEDVDFEEKKRFEAGDLKWQFLPESEKYKKPEGY